MHRLKTRAQFQATMAGGVVSRTAHFALHRLVFDPVKPSSLTEPDVAPDGVSSQALFGVGGVWLGAMAPKRWARRAVTRNAIKRQIYALGADYAPDLVASAGRMGAGGAAFVVRLRAAFDRKQYASAWSEPLRCAVRAELQQLLGRAAASKAAKPVAAAVAQQLQS